LEGVSCGEGRTIALDQIDDQRRKEPGDARTGVGDRGGDTLVLGGTCEEARAARNRGHAHWSIQPAAKFLHSSLARRLSNRALVICRSPLDYGKLGSKLHSEGLGMQFGSLFTHPLCVSRRVGLFGVAGLLGISASGMTSGGASAWADELAEYPEPRAIARS